MRFKELKRKWVYAENSFHNEDSHVGLQVAQRGWTRDLLHSLLAQLSCDTTVTEFPVTLQFALKAETIPKDKKITVVTSDLWSDFFSGCFKESGDVQRNVHMGDVFICSPLEQEEFGDLHLGWG